MPSLLEHYKRSKERTGESFEELHNWMDEPQRKEEIIDGIERHDISYARFVKERFGYRSVIEFLRHIAEDYHYTAGIYLGMD